MKNCFLYLRSTHIIASCEMDLHDFPMDTQHCKLTFGSCKFGLNFVHGARDSISVLVQL